jgi:hypothetical protein
MRQQWWTVAVPMIALAAGALMAADQLPMEPLHDSGQSITGAFEGWFQNQDGTYSLLVGYFNRNLKEEIDIPVGPNNKIEPGGPDRGQPTHFLPRRQWGMFTVIVPKDFGTTTRLTWTIVANGKKTEIPIDIDPLWEISPYSEVGMGNTPPVLSFGDKGPTVQGPRPVSAKLTATVGTPLPLNIWVADDAKTFPNAKPPKTPAVVVTWSEFRGPAGVTFSEVKPKVEKDESKATPEKPFAGKAATTATFSEPGDYVLHVTLNDWSGEGGRGFQCCWTNGLVDVSVTK